MSRSQATPKAAKQSLHYGDMSAVHTLNNLALVVWAMLTYPDDFDAAIGEVVTADSTPIATARRLAGCGVCKMGAHPQSLDRSMAGAVGVGLAGQANLELGDLVDRTFSGIGYPVVDLGHVIRVNLTCRDTRLSPQIPQFLHLRGLRLAPQNGKTP